ncbi:MAG: hypothetical protein GXO32_05895 [Crenarchaeota archaeon]|nr:hypothetical protein [Thermoproteota archaeon]
MHSRALYLVCPRCGNPMEIHGRFAVCRICGYRARVEIGSLHPKPLPA